MLLARDTFQRMETAIAEPQSRSRHEVLDRVGDQDLAPFRQRGDAGADVHGNTDELGPAEFALARMESSPYLEPEAPYPRGDGTRGADASRRTVETGQEPVSGRIDLAPAELHEAFADEPVVGLKQITPAAIAQGQRGGGGVHDVREQYGREDPVGIRAAANPRQEFFDLVEDRVAVTREGYVIDPGKLDVPGGRDPLGHVPAALDRHGAVTRVVDDEGRNADRR